MMLGLGLSVGAGGGGWTPASLSSLYRWGEATQWDGGASYLDLSGNGRTMTKSGTNTLSADSGGRAIMVSGAAATDYFERVEQTTYGPTTLSFCTEITSEVNRFGSLFSSDDAAGDFQIDGAFDGTFKIRFNATGLGETSAPLSPVDWLDGSPHVFTIVLDTASSLVSVRVDGTVQDTDTLTSSSFTTDKISLFANRSKAYGIGCNHYGEIINGSVDAAEIAKIETYLGNLAGLSI